MSHALKATSRALSSPKLVWRISIGVFLLTPWLVSSFSYELTNRLTLAAAYALAGLSVVVLTGWLGQVSLAQGALMGIGAFTAGRLAAELSIPFPWGSVVSAAGGALAAIIMGATALRLRGLYLAVATLTFQYAVEESLLQWKPFSGGYQGVTLPPLRWGFLDFTDDTRLYFYLAWATFLVCAVVLLNLRDSKVGRAWLTIKEAEAAAAAVGIPVTRYRLGAFAVSGALAGISGSLIAWQIGHTDRLEYVFQTSILVLAVAVIGGLSSVWGVAAAAVIFALIAFVTSGIEFLAGKIFIVSGALLLLSLFLEPEGLAGGFAHRRQRRAERRRQRTPDFSPEPKDISPNGKESADRKIPAAQPAVDGSQEPSGQEEVQPALIRPPAANVEISTNGKTESPPLLTTTGLTVRFGGITACDEVSIEIGGGELVGLVGPNGAGKTTLLGVISGFITPVSGRVSLMGRDVTSASVHSRASMGLARTFQISRVITSLTVMENLLVGSFLQDKSKPVAQALQLPSALREKKRLDGRVRDVATLLGLSDVLGVKVSSLPLASARLVEVGRALLLNPSVILLDEPASGLDRDSRELLAERLTELRELGLGLLLIEHDFEMVSALSDRVYVMDYGRVVAHGDPKKVSRDERVIQAYLGDRFALAGGEAVTDGVAKVRKGGARARG